MQTIYYTDGQIDEIIMAVGLTVGDFTMPEDGTISFGNMDQGFKRKMNVDLSTLDGSYTGAGVIGYFNEVAMKRPRKGLEVPILIEWIAAGNRTDVVLQPLAKHCVESIKGVAPAHQLSIEEQQALFVRVLGKDWKRQVEKFITFRDKLLEKNKPGQISNDTK